MSVIKTVGVVGCGQMGGGIAQACVLSGYDTIVREADEALLKRGADAVADRLEKAVSKGKLEASERDAALARLRGTVRLEDLAGCDLVIEAVVEDPVAKGELWRALDAVCKPEAIFASNTSSLPIADMAAATGRPGRFVGLHFFNPVPVMKLVEVVRTVATEPGVYEAAFAFARSLGKEPVACKDDSGFIVNLLLIPFLLDAVRALERGVASTADIDAAMRLGAGHPMGPLALCDFIGNDTMMRIGQVMHGEYQEPRYAPPPLLKRMVALGYLGRKAGRGFYDYATEPPKPVELGL